MRLRRVSRSFVALAAEVVGRQVLRIVSSGLRFVGLRPSCLALRAVRRRVRGLRGRVARSRA